MYHNGSGALTDNEKAYMYFNLGAYNGNKLAAKNQEVIAKNMTKDQIAKAQKMSSRCMESRYTDC